VNSKEKLESLIKRELTQLDAEDDENSASVSIRGSPQIGEEITKHDDKESI
jgi:hypothetical protein